MSKQAHLSLLGLLAVAGAACSAPASTAEHPEPSSPVPEVAAAKSAGEDSEPKPAVEEAEPEPVRHELPTACSDPNAELCTPPVEFAEALCTRGKPDIAFALFRKGSPWTRAYVRFPLEAWYAGGGHASPEKLLHNEEVLVLRNRTRTTSGGPKISGAGSYDIYRWSGSCVSVQTDEVTLKKIGLPRAAPIVWRHLDDRSKSSLLEDKGIAYRNKMRVELCQGEKLGGRACRNTLEGLTTLIADFVRKGGEVPVPELVVD